MRLKLGKRIAFYLPEIQIKGLKALTRKTGLSASEHVRRAIDWYLEEQRKKKKGS